MDKKNSIASLKGIGEKTEALFHKVGVYRIGDLIRYYPRGFEMFDDPIPISEAEEGRVCTVAGSVFGRISVSAGRRRQVTALNLKDLTGTMKVIWFNMPFLRNTLGKGGVLILRGRVSRRKEGLVLEHPEIYYPAAKYEEKLHTMQPVYPLTAGLTNNTVIKAVKQALACTDDSDDILPEYLSAERAFLPYRTSVEKMHFPGSRADFAAARQRFVYEEFLTFILSLRRMREEDNRAENTFVFRDVPETDRFLAELPYRLTGAQMRVWEEIKSDMKGQHVMSRLVQGDVGSGKTIIAFLGLLFAGLNGYQGAMMAPTEVLARQHYENISGMLKRHHLPLKAELLTGSMTAKQKREAYERIESGEASIIVGTHALIQDKAVYHDLALVVTDEQHRFGVRQREALAGKGAKPHILVMSATPIPRTLAIILYGDLDVSVIDEMPKDRLPIKNCVVNTDYREKAYAFMKKQISAGRQCYVICPMVEESESMEAENVIDYSRMLSDELGNDITVGYLHGRMKQQEKDEIMSTFGKMRYRCSSRLR